MKLWIQIIQFLVITCLTMKVNFSTIIKEIELYENSDGTKTQTDKG